MLGTSEVTQSKATAQRAPLGWTGRIAALLGSRSVGGTRRMQHLESLALGPKRCLYLVECDGERFLVAAGSDSLSAPVALRHAVPQSRGPE